MISMIDQAAAFVSNWLSPPGETIDDMLEERHWTPAELAGRAGLTRKHVDDLITGRAAITAETAARLERALGGAHEFWLRRESQYRAALERQQTDVENI
jgi:HTH-type transcriptional regulator / antitoxin HigA